MKSLIFAIICPFVIKQSRNPAQACLLILFHRLKKREEKIIMTNIAGFDHHVNAQSLSDTTVAGELQATTNGVTTVGMIHCQGSGDRKMQGICVHGSTSAKSSEVGRGG